MNLICDLCGSVLTQTDDSHAVCDCCGIVYGPDRLEELRKAAVHETPLPTAEENPKPQTIPEEPKSQQIPQEPKPWDIPTGPTPAKEPANPQPVPQQRSGCGIWTLVIVALLDLVVGTHGIVALFCLVIIWIISRFSTKK